MLKYVIKKSKNKDAQALVEFALCLPFIVLVLGIMITVGQMTYTKQVLQCAAQTAGRTYIEVAGTNVTTTNRTALEISRQVANAIISTAGFGLELPDEEAAFTVSSAESLVLDGHLSDKYKTVTVQTKGKIHILFPVTWQGVIVTDSDRGSYMTGSIVMLLENTEW